MNQIITDQQSIGKRLPIGLFVVAILMIVFGLAEVGTGFTHQFFGLTTVQADISTYLGVALGLFYLASGILILTKRRWAATIAIVLLFGDVLGRIAMTVYGLYPLSSFRQTFGIVVGTAIAIFFAIYIGLKLKSFR